MFTKKYNNPILKKYAVASLLSLSSMSSMSAMAASHTVSGNFTMLDSTAGVVGGSTDISGVFDDTLLCSAESCADESITISSAQTFFGTLWTAHHARVFVPGTYTIDSDCSGEDIAAGRFVCEPTGARVNDPVVTDPNIPADTVDGPDMTLTVGPGELGGHMLFNWGSSTNIHVAVLWNYHIAFGTPIYDGNCAGSAPTCDAAQTPTRPWNWTSVDGDGDGTRGFDMVNGPFGGFSANFSLDMVTPYTAPVAADDAAATPPSTLKVIDVLANDSDAEDDIPLVGATVTLLTTTSALNGTLLNNGDGTVSYTPHASLVTNDVDTFDYTITDSDGAVSNAATVTITIGSNNAPTANDVAFSTAEDTQKIINITDLDDASTAIGDDSDGGTQTLTFASLQSPTAQGGTVSGGGTGTITYTPAVNFHGTDTFTFAVNDGFENSALATMTITVTAVNDAPVCSDAELGTNPDKVLSIDVATDLLAGCTDVEGQTITLVSVTQPVEVGAMLANDGAGTLTYTPAPAFIGVDSFVFTVTDTHSNTNATAYIAVKNLGNFTMLDAQGKVFGGTNDVIFTWDNTEHSAETDLGSNMTIASEGPAPFFGAPWFAHHVRVFGPGDYTFEADNKLCESKSASPDAAHASEKTAKLTPSADDIDVTGCPGTGSPTTMSMTVLPGQLGVHMLFDYNGSFDIDVVNVWDQGAVWNDPTGQGDAFNDLWDGAAGVPPDPTTTWDLISTDVNGDGFNGSPMLDGPFMNFYANFNNGPGGAGVAKEPITTTARDTSVGGALSWLVLLGMLPLISLFRMRMK